MTTPIPGLEPDSPYLDTDPPPWAARGLSTVLIALFAAVVIAAAVVQIPETVSGSFVLVPERGADPVRVPREGTVAEVRAAEGSETARGATLFVIRSQPVGDRAAEARTLAVQASGAEGRMANARTEYESETRATALERQRLERRLASLGRVADLKRKQLAVTREMADKSKRGQTSGAIGGWEADRLVLEADRLEAESEQAAAEMEETRSALAKLGQDALTRDVRYREQLRALEQERDMARVRIAALQRQLAGETGGTPDASGGPDAGAASIGDLVVTSPCEGTVLRLAVSTPGAVVQPGDMLGEVACRGSRLQVEMALGQREVARVREQQSAKLMYDAFPYQRYGVKTGRVRWVGPATALARQSAPAAPDAGAFRALIDAEDTTVVVQGERRPLLVGMRGTARVVVGRRTLISFAFEPIRQLRENLRS